METRAGDWIFVAASYQGWNPLNHVLRLNARREVVDAYATSGYWNAPISVLLSRDESTLYVGTGNGFVNAFDVESGKRLFDLGVGSVVVALAQHPTRDIVYASGFHGVVEIDARTGTFRELEIGGYADGVYTQGIGLSPDGRELYVAYRHGVRPSVLVWDTERRAVTDSIPLPAMGQGLVVTPDGAHIYVGSETLHPGEVWVIDRIHRTLIKTIPVGGVVQKLAISSDGFTVVAPNSSGWVDFIR